MHCFKYDYNNHVLFGTNLHYLFINFNYHNYWEIHKWQRSDFKITFFLMISYVNKLKVGEINVSYTFTMMYFKLFRKLQ